MGFSPPVVKVRPEQPPGWGSTGPEAKSAPREVSRRRPRLQLEFNRASLP